MHPAMMFVPGSAPDKLAKIPSLPGDALLLDLEDSVAASAKATARALVAEALTRFGTVRPLWVRVNAFSTELLYDDLEAVTVGGLEGINLPKVESARELHLVDWLLSALERRRGLACGTVRLMATIESALGLQRVEEIVRRGRVRGFVPWLITQRPAVLHKDVLSQADILVSMKLTSSQDREAVGRWIEGQASRAEGRRILAALPRLAQGEGWVWAPSDGVLERVAFPRIRTFDSSATPQRPKRAGVQGGLAAVDLAAIRAALGGE